MEIVSIVSLVIGVVSFAASTVFFWLGSKSERRNQALLQAINDAIEKWQSEIMASSIELLNSRPEIVAKNASLEDAKAKHDFIAQLGERIKFIIENPAPGDLGPGQSHNLQQLIDCFQNSTKSSLSPDVISELVLSKHKEKQE